MTSATKFDLSCLITKLSRAQTSLIFYVPLISHFLLRVMTDQHNPPFKISEAHHHHRPYLFYSGLPVHTFTSSPTSQSYCHAPTPPQPTSTPPLWF
jgi:hypothetical protein